ncbi:GntR family transcriptional regulator [Nocardioides sp.]|uniref:GntR family transcriptional regulator n=1 Tax=Nocardioides sp. TaxID=35761 RepID=UPI0019CC343D|nr:GntR family transcriptional regulator [Nocardioides sp.]MBC7279188.1 GntR family transcriptional regulator [Nocardioides sp.]
MNLSKPLQPTLLADQVYDVLHKAIVSGELPAGSRLRIRDVAEQVGTSVMPVREAIRRLEEGGFAEREPHKGAVVKGLTLEELIHVYDVRKVLEREAARLGAERITAEGCARMEAEYGFMRAAIAEGRLEDHLRRDEAVLTALFEASGNPVLVKTIQNLWVQCRAYKTLGIKSTFDSSTSNEVLWRYQGDLVEAARAHDPAAAVATSDASLEVAAEEIRRRLAAEKSDADEAVASA